MVKCLFLAAPPRAVFSITLIYWYSRYHYTVTGTDTTDTLIIDTFTTSYLSGTHPSLRSLVAPKGLADWMNASIDLLIFVVNAFEGPWGPMGPWGRGQLKE